MVFVVMSLGAVPVVLLTQMVFMCGYIFSFSRVFFLQHTCPVTDHSRFLRQLLDPVACCLLSLLFSFLFLACCLCSSKRNCHSMHFFFPFYDTLFPFSLPKLCAAHLEFQDYKGVSSHLLMRLGLGT